MEKSLSKAPTTVFSQYTIMAAIDKTKTLTYSAIVKTSRFIIKTFTFCLYLNNKKFLEKNETYLQHIER